MPSAGDGDFCIGEPVVLAAGGDADTYTWDPTDLDPPVGITTYTLTGVFDETGCINTSTVDVTVHELPTVLATAEDETVCTGDLITLFGSGAETYEWPLGIIDGEAFAAGDLPGTTTYIVTGTDEFGCQNADEVTIIIGDLIAITYAITEEMLGGDGEINITVSGGIAPYVFDWDIDESGDFDDDEDLTGLTAGFYEVVVMGQGECEASEIINLGSQVGISENALSFEMYPNPAQNKINIAFEGSFDYELFNMTGQLVGNGLGNDFKTIGIDNLEDGTYMIVLYANGVAHTVLSSSNYKLFKH